MFDYEKQLAGLTRQTVLCVGDVMLDRYVYGDVARVSPEAPTVVLRARREEIAPGGAANVALNIGALGSQCILVGVISADETGRVLATALTSSGGVENHLVLDPTRPTTMKARFVSEHYSTHLLRADWEDGKAIDKEREDDVIARAEAALPKCGALILSDYGKGVLTPRVVEKLIAAARKSKKPVIVDPKGNDYSIYKGATVITPNRAELSRAVNRDVRTTEEVVKAAQEICKGAGVDAILVTRSEEGMSLVRAKGRHGGRGLRLHARTRRRFRGRDPHRQRRRRGSRRQARDRHRFLQRAAHLPAAGRATRL
jgi:D-beta-D-heptose 7-phosphate kinase/D-beta-D-heptose 1-phosphate adenosyltransferase